MVIISGLILLTVGIIFKLRPPKNINSFYGYRTPRSMRDQAHWDFAHKYSANLCIYLGLASLAVTPLGWILDYSERTEEMIGGVWILLLIATWIVRTEMALKNKFKQ